MSRLPADNERNQIITDSGKREQLFEQAEGYFKAYPGNAKLSRHWALRSINTPVSFLRSTKGSLFALTGHRLRKKNGRIIGGSDADSIKLITDRQGKTFFLKRHRKNIEKDDNWNESLEVIQAMFGDDFHEIKRGMFTYHVYPYLGVDWETYIDRNLQECKTEDAFNAFAVTLRDLCLQAKDVVEDFHSKHFVHGDIKLNNFTVTLSEGEKPTLKLIDFGISRNINKHNPFQVTNNDEYVQIPEWARSYNRGKCTYTFTQDSDRWTLGWALNGLIRKVRRKNTDLYLYLEDKLREIITELQKEPIRRSAQDQSNPTHSPTKHSADAEISPSTIGEGTPIKSPIQPQDIPTYALATKKGKTICAVAGVGWGVSAISGLLAWTLSSCSLPDASIQSAILIGLAITAIVACIIAIPTTAILARDNHRFHVMKKGEQQKPTATKNSPR